MDKKISALTTAAPLTGTELVPVVQGGQTVKTTAQDIADLGGGGGGIVTTTEAALAALETAGTLSTTVLYMVTDSSPYKLLCKAETASQLSRTAQIVDAVYSGSVNYDVQSGAMYGVAIIDSGNKPNQWFGALPSAWSFGSSPQRNVFYTDTNGSLGNNANRNTFQQNAANNTLGNDCFSNTFEQDASANTLGNDCVNNTFKQGASAFTFAKNLQNVTIEAGTVGADYTASPTYDFLYNNTYPATIFSDGSLNYHRYYDVANDQIVITLLSSPYTVSYIGGGGGGGLLSGTATQVSAGTYTATISGAGAYTIGDTYVIKFATANDGASTININGQGAINIFKNTSTPISSGDIKANQTIVIVYDGTNFQAIGLVSSQLLAYVHNAEASAITKGQVVYAHQASGNKMSVKLAKADTDGTSAKTIGMVYDTSIAAGGEGYIIIQGVIEGLNTAAYNAGDTLYLSGTTFGGVTNVKQYAPTHLVYVGIVERANAGNGQIYVRCQNGYELDELHDVSAQTPIDGDTLIYNSSNGLWEANFNQELQLVLTASFRFLTGN